MSWKIFLSPNTPPLVDPDQMNIHALSRRERSSKRKCDQFREGSERQLNRSRMCSISRMLLRDPSVASATKLNSTTLIEINDTLKEMRLIAIDGNSTLHRFLELVEKQTALKTNTKPKSSAKTSRDQKSTVKKRGSKLGSRLEEKINIKISEFDKAKKGFDAMKKSLTLAKFK